MGRARLAVLVAVAGMAAAAGTVLLWPGEAPRAARAVPAAPGLDDPLTSEEIARASLLASHGLRDHLSGGRTELLYVERDDDKAAEGTRRADAYLYDYGSDRLIVRTVDLARRKVVAERRGRGVQAPPSKREELRAAELLIAHPTYGKGVREAYEKAAGRKLRSATDLGTRGLIFTPAHRHGLPVRCARHRCLRLFVRLPDGRWLDTSRIVADLSAGKIYTLEW
jgi:hypothetical protein